jgi:hypothetical protein
MQIKFWSNFDLNFIGLLLATLATSIVPTFTF